MKKIVFLSCFFMFFYHQGWSLVELIEARKLKRDMILVGKTRMAGNKMIEFKLKILSVLLGSSPGEDSILAEIDNDLIRETGVLAGMSGSPVYYNNKLVGSVAYTSSFMKKPIVGITPIKNMLRLINYSFKEKKTDYLSSKNLHGMEPINTSIAISGGFYLNKQFFKKILGYSSGVLVTPQGVSDPLKSKTKLQNSEDSVESKIKLKAGDACSINYVRGDLNISALGTVTYVSNDFILAMGHPLNLAGKVKLPLHKSYIDAVVPRLNLSYKISSLGEEVGVVLEDRSTAILGKIGEKAPRIPLKVTLKSPLQKKHFSYEITADKNQFASMATVVLLNSFTHYENLYEDSSLFYTIKLHTDYKDKVITLKDMASSLSSENTLQSLSAFFRLVLDYLSQNRFLEINIKKIEVSLESKQSIYYSLINNLQSDKQVYHPGETIYLKAQLAPYKRKNYWKNLSIKIPKKTKEGYYKIYISSGYYFLYLDSLFSPEKYEAQSIEHLFKLLNSDISSKTLITWMYMNSLGVFVKDKEYKRLPYFQRKLIRSSRQSRKSSSHEFLVKYEQLNEVVIGSHFIEVEVVKNKF